MKHIAFFVPTLELGGAERTVTNLSSGFAGRGYEVDIVLAKARGGFLNQVHRDVNVIDLNRTPASLLGIASAIPAFTRYVNEKSPDTIVSFMGHVNVISIISASLSNRSPRLVISERNSLTTDSFNDKIVRFLQRIFYSKADVIVPNSDDVAHDLKNILKIPEKMVRKIHNPTVTPKLKSDATEEVKHPWFKNDSPPVILGVGSLTTQKQFDTLLRAFYKLTQSKDARLVIIGSGPKRGYLERLARDLNIEKKVDLHGQNPNPYKYMANADAFALSSAWEGLPNVVIEALALECPVVATDAPGGTSEILEEGEHGILVPVGDSKKLGQALRFILNHPPERTRLSVRAEDFSIDKIVTDYEEVV